MHDRLRPRFRGLPLATALFACVTLCGGADIRLDPRVAPTFQSIELEIDADRPDYRGSVRIELKVSEPTDRFRFHAQDQEFERVELTGAEGPIALEIQRGDDGLVTAIAERPLTPGPHTLAIDFTHEFNTQAVGLYRMEYEERGYLFTQFEAIEARRAFPCWDEPIFKIPFQLRLTVPEAHVAVTNTPVESESVADGRKTILFKRTKPLPTYLLAIASGPLDSVPITGLSVPGRIYTVRGHSEWTGLAVAATPKVLERLETYFGSAYPYAKCDFIAIPEYWYGAMENPGAITYAESVLVIDPKTATAAQRVRLTGVIAHELAHIWFGDLVTMSWWDDLWLNESFASWLDTKITHQLLPDLGVDLSRRRSTSRMMNGDARPSTKAIRQPVESTEQIFTGMEVSFAKGEAVLGMVEQWLGEEVFRRGVVDYINAHAWGNAVGADLWNALSEASEQDVGAVMSGFMDQPGVPLILGSLDGDGRIRLAQQRFLNHGVEAPAQSWRIPVRLRFGNAERVEEHELMLAAGTATIDPGFPIDWFLPDSGAHGYFRWNLPTPLLLLLADRAVELLDPAERIAFLGNAAALLDAGRIDGADYLRVLGAFAAYVRETLGPVLDRVGLRSRNDEEETVSELRRRLFDWLGTEGRDPKVRAEAVRLTRAYLKDPASIDNMLAEVALRVAAIDGDQQLFDTYKARFETAKVPAERERFLSSLGAFESPKIQQQALDYVLQGPLRPNEIFTIQRGMADTDRNGRLGFDWMTTNYDAITARVPPMFAAYLPYAASGCSLERLERAREFFSEPEHDVAGTGATLQRVADQVTDCAALREREGRGVAAYLESVE
jgi:alanyl aminopeptidase